MTIDDLLKMNCVADTSLLSNFVFTGSTHLLQKLVNGPLHLPPAILDPEEVPVAINKMAPPHSEFLKPLYERHGEIEDRYKAAAPFITSFSLGIGSIWNPIELNVEELELARKYSRREVWQETQGVDTRFKKRGLGAGEAEACSIAAKRGWTLLIDDQPALELLKGLGLNVPCIRTCTLLKQAVDKGHLQCEEAMEIFNTQIVDKFGFHATRMKGAERLWFRCNPTNCIWAAA